LIRKIITHVTSSLIALILIGIILILSSCANAKGDGYAIYLTKGDILPSQLATLSYIDPVEEPIISMKDVITYNTQTHELKLTESAYQRVSQMDIPVRGKSFVVCVDGKPIFSGAFWTPISSMSFDGVTIWKPLSPREPNIINLELGYPSSSFYGGKDPRNSPEIIRSLEQAGKLITGLSIMEVNALPRSLKGYELYSWLGGDQWHFTLITGTNRNKTLEEIISKEDFISESGWVRIHVTGVDALKTVLSKLHQGEEIIWLAKPRLEKMQQGDINFMPPPAIIIDSIKEYAGQYSLNLYVN
jgi:hypothetical protein